MRGHRAAIADCTVWLSPHDCEQNAWIDFCFAQGFLDPAECKKFLQDAAKGQEPTDEEVQFVIKATHEKENREGAGLTMSEMSVALDVWRTWEQVKPEMAMYMQKYDSNASGKLEMDQLKELLQTLA